MSASKCGRAWIAAGSVGAVEALKDQLGLCRWNYAIRSIHHNTKSSIIRSLGQAKNQRESGRHGSDGEASAGAVVVRRRREFEESLRKVMYLRCWGPNN